MQTTHVKAMNAAGIDWMLISKGSQPALEDQICSFGWESFPPQHITDETGHGRHDVRVIRAAPATEAIRTRWPGAAQMFLIERYRHPRAPWATPASAGPARPAARTPGRRCSPAPGSWARRCRARP